MTDVASDVTDEPSDTTDKPSDLSDHPSNMPREPQDMATPPSVELKEPPGEADNPSRPVGQGKPAPYSTCARPCLPMSGRVRSWRVARKWLTTSPMPPGSAA